MKSVIGVGTDIIEINRIKKAVLSDRFVQKVFTVNERRYAEEKHNPYQTYAGMFAAKEAAVKAMGGSIADYEVIHQPDGKPVLKDKNAYLSISHCELYAVAFVTAYSADE